MRRTAGQSLDAAIVGLRSDGVYVKETKIDPVSGVAVFMVGAAARLHALLQNAAAKKVGVPWGGIFQ